MYRKRDTYLIDYHMNLSDSADVCRLINEKFRAAGMGFPVGGASVQNCIMFFAYLCQYITYEELCIFLGKYFSSPRVRQCMTILINKKLMRKEVFPHGESQSRCAYCLTKHGIEHILPLIPYDLSHNIKPRRSGSIVPLHDYYCGINMMHFFLAPFSCTWDKELVFSNKLRPDIVLRTYDSNQTIYIEQDMGTESKGELLDKLTTYHGLGLTQNAIIIFSMSTRLSAPGIDSGLSRKFLKILCEVMDKCGFKSVFDLYEDYLRSGSSTALISALKAPERFISQLEEFLVWTGVCRSMGSPVSAMSTKNLNRFSNHDFTRTELSRYLEDLKTPCNPYINMYINHTAASYSFSKYCSLLDTLFYYIHTASWDMMPYVRSLLGGLPVFVVPTNLLCNYFPYIFPITYKTINRYVKSLSDYFPGISINDYEIMRPAFFPADTYPGIVFRDSFLYNGGLIIVSSAYNMSTISQAKLLLEMQYQDMQQYRFLHFLFIVDEYEQALKIHNLLMAPCADSEQEFYPPKDHTYLTISYLLTRECGKRERLFTIYRYPSREYGRFMEEPIYLFPIKYSNKGQFSSDIEKKQFSHFYDIPGYNDMDDSLAIMIREELDEEELDEEKPNT